jgi:ABC-type transport system substrate-binding protein
VSFYSNPAFDRLVDSSRIELDSARRAELYRRADSIAFADAPMGFLFFYNELYAVQPWVRGFQVPVIFNGQRWVQAELR